jgi:energy-coupling factor transporter ATP-binding protein EcfA2
MERLGLAGRLATLTVTKLSAGQRRRAALAVVIARRPELWLLDEPHAGLDAAGRAVLDAVVASSPAEGRTVILASHELDRTRALAHREVVLSGGVTHFGVAESRIAELSDAKTQKEPVAQ